jgi:hypothetical protein
MLRPVNTILPAVFFLAALLMAQPAAANAAADAAADVPVVLKVKLPAGDARRGTGKSFLDHTRPSFAEESYSVPATFPGPLVAAPRRKPDTAWMLAACFGLLIYLGLRRSNALGLAGGM